MNKASLVKKLKNDVKKLENQIEHRKLYNMKSYIMKALIKSGIAIDYALPFIIMAIITANDMDEKGNLPFRIDEFIEKARIETIDTSNGTHIEHISYDYDYDEEMIEHSTGWIKNDKNLYERTVTSYRLSNEIDLSDTERILSMTKEEIEKILVVTNVKTIYKNTLTPEDEMYDDDALIIINHTESEDDMITRQETTGENVLNSILYIVISLLEGITLGKLGKIFFKTYFRDILREYEPSFRPINKEELEALKRMLEVKKENLSMISETENNSNHSNYSYKLRKL